MECCQPTDNRSRCVPCVPRIDLDLHSKTEAMGDVLKYFFSPEPSDRNQRQPGPVRPRWMGSIKALFWVLISILTGTALAIFCG